ncbi:MAG: NAD(P)H-dependent oxidoreductase subunit E [Chloroflexota bacterium]
MDLHVVGPLASPAERAAIDAVLDPEIGPASGWTGGERSADADGHVARGGHEARSRRDLLLPALHALQSHSGWISQAGLNHICRRLTVPPADAYGVATFYSLFSTVAREPAVAHVCDDIACRLAGAEELCAEMERRHGPEDGAWSRSPCLGQCERAPAALVTRAGADASSHSVTLAGAESVIAALGDASPGAQPPAAASVPQFGQDGLRLLSRVGHVDPASIDDYRAHDGYMALARALRIGPAAVIAEVTESGLLGRGGAAFPTGRKWAAVASQVAQPHYVVCNADESEPGTFKDRVLLEHDPFAVVEAMTIEAFAVGAEKGYLYIRGEYPLAEARIGGAIGAARSASLLGTDILGSGFSFDIELRRGAGAYICGEETALFASIEGKRGEPTNKPPYPVEVGLFGKPTAVNNVETLANVLLILASDDAAATYKQSGTEGSAGPKLFCLSGHVSRPGVYEVPFGTTLGELIEQAGGVPGGRDIKAILLGGAAGSFVGPEALDTELTFEGTRAIGASLGSRVIMVFDETADMVGTLRRIAAFFRDESCGHCVPCRVGTVRQEEALARLAAAGPGGEAREATALLGELGQVMRDASICGLGQTASSAIESALRRPEMMSL